MQLNADGTMIEVVGYSISTPCQEIKVVGTYTLKCSKLSLNNDGGIRNYDVIKQMDSELKYGHPTAQLFICKESIF